MTSGANLLTTRLMLNRELRRLEGNSCGILVANCSDLGTVFDIPSELLPLLNRFITPLTPMEVLGDLAAERLQLLQNLVERRFLLPEGVPNETLSLKFLPAESTFVGAPSVSIKDSSLYDCLLVGIPYDGGVLGRYQRGAAFGPRSIRLASQEFAERQNLETGIQSGWFDFDVDKKLLENIRIGDLGDLSLGSHSVSGMELLKAVAQILRIAICQGARKIGFLGGDHSITFGSISALDDEVTGFIHLDAHSDLARIRYENDIHHGNIVRWILGINHIEHVLHCGIRGVDSMVQDPGCSKYQQITMKSVREMDFENVRLLCKKELKYYVSIDLDVLDSSIVAETTVPTPNGFHFQEFKNFLLALLNDVNVVGFDIVEHSPSQHVSSSATARAASQITLHLLDQMCKRNFQTRH